MSEEPKSALLEQVVTAHRERDAEGRPIPPPAWWDLGPEDMDEIVRRQLEQRALERALNPRGWNATVAAVMRRVPW